MHSHSCAVSIVVRVSIVAALGLFLCSTGVAVPSAVIAQDVETYGGGVSVMLDPIPSQRRYEDRQDIFQLDPETPLQAVLGFQSYYSEPTPFRIFFLLNYAQASIGSRSIAAPDESEQQPLASLPQIRDLHQVMELIAPPEEELYFQIWTEPLATRYYDLSLIVVPDPDKNQRQLPYWTVRQFATRATVYVGDVATPPEIDYPLIDPTPGDDSGSSELLWFGREPHRAGLKAEREVAAGEEVTLTVNYQPYTDALADDLPEGTPLPVAFVAIIDDRVVPLNGQPVLYGAAVTGRLSWLPATVQVPNEPGPHQLFIQQFPNPYVDAREAEETGREFFGTSSQRFILDAA